MKKIRFIINPNSGVVKKEHVPDLINAEMDKLNLEAEICFTKAPRHAIDLAREAAEKKFDLVVAVGGDGSVNETASSLVNTSTALGIIPCGSGNGMARHLGISVNIKKALKVFGKGKIIQMDTFTINDRFCIGTAGIGFDAHIAHLFAEGKKRGYYQYAKLVLSNFVTFKSTKHSFELDMKPHAQECFVLTVANSSQYGNNAVIAPHADVQDGLLDISIIKKFPAVYAPSLIFRIMNKSIHHSRYYESFNAKEVNIKIDNEILGHIDGEPVIFNSDLNIRIHPLSLKILVPQSSKITS